MSFNYLVNHPFTLPIPHFACSVIHLSRRSGDNISFKGPFGESAITLPHLPSRRCRPEKTAGEFNEVESWAFCCLGMGSEDEFFGSSLVIMTIISSSSSLPWPRSSYSQGLSTWRDRRLETLSVPIISSDPIADLVLLYNDATTLQFSRFSSPLAIVHLGYACLISSPSFGTGFLFGHSFVKRLLL